jgi:hypothetical protein
MTAPKTATKTAPKTAKEQWNAVFEYAASRDVESIADMTEDELDRELAEAGPEAVALAAEGVAEHEAAVRAAKEKGEGASPTATTQPRRLRTYGWAAGALAAAAATAVGVGSLLPTVTGHPVENEDKPGALRRWAAEDCEARRWASCLAALDEAKKLDPAGDSAPQIVKMRAAAVAGLAASGGK